MKRFSMEQQNVLIARALMGNPEILVLDEPGTGLDVIAREGMMERVRYLAENTDITIIYVTHYPEEILPSFDKTLLLRNGATYKTGATHELFTSEVMSDFFSYPAVIKYSNERYNFSIESEALDTVSDGLDRKDGAEV